MSHKLLDNYNAPDYGSIDHPDDRELSEPLYAKFLRCVGCLIGYSSMVLTLGCCAPYKVVGKGNDAIITEFGKIHSEVSEGMHYVNPITQSLISVSNKIIFIDLERQNIMTSDKLAINIDGIVSYRITNIRDVLFKVSDIKTSITQLAYTTLKDVVGKTSLDECISGREILAKHVNSIVTEAVKDWGIEIISIQIKDILMSKDTAELLSASVVAERRAKAKLISAQADIEAANMIRIAAENFESNNTIQYKTLDILSQLAQNPNKTIVMVPSTMSFANAASVVQTTLNQ